MSILRLTEEQLVEMIQQVILEKKKKKSKKKKSKKKKSKKKDTNFALVVKKPLKLNSRFIHQHTLTVTQYKYVRGLCQD